MQPVSSLYEQILAIEGHIKTYYISIQNNAGTFIDYTGANLISAPKITGRLFTDDSFSVGGVCSSKLEFELVPTAETIKKMAEIKVYARLEYQNLVSEWIDQGIYYIYTREKVPPSEKQPMETLKITAYDAMLKADTFLLDIDDPTTGWPKSMYDVAAQIAQDIGVQLDPGTANFLSTSLVCEIDYSMTRRDYLAAIAKAHAGNWIITYDGKLKLISIFNEYNLLSTEEYVPITFGGTAILV